MELEIEFGGNGKTVPAIFLSATNAVAAYAFAHGAGAGMRHHWMEDMALALQAAGISTLRYNFPYIDQRRPPDRPPVLVGVVRSACAKLAELCPDLPLFAGGKSMGGRMTSTAQAEKPLEYVKGLVFFGFPLHPPKNPEVTRAEHLFHVQIPMLFLQGERDELATLELLTPIVHELKATVHVVPKGSHSLEAPKSSGVTPQMLKADLARITLEWMRAQNNV